MLQKNIDILRGEFIGRRVSVHDKMIEGKIIDETKDSFLIMTGTGRKRVRKADSLFKMDICGNFVEIDGKIIAMRPEDRVKIRVWK